MAQRSLIDRKPGGRVGECQRHVVALEEKEGRGVVPETAGPRRIGEWRQRYIGAFRSPRREREPTRAIIQLLPRYPEELYPTKVLIFVRRPLRAPITLRGRRCSDGRALRFWYRADDGEPPGAGSSSQLEQAGDLVAQLHPGEPPITQPALGYPGYVLFSAPGRWKVSARQNGRLVGTVVFRVVAP